MAHQSTDRNPEPPSADAAPPATLAEALDALERQTALLHMVIHDLRTPLASMLGYTDLLQRGVFGALSAEQNQALDQIFSSGLFANRLVEDLLDSAALEADTFALAHNPFDIRDVARHVLEAYRPQAEQKRLALELVSTSDLPLLIGDATRVQQILFNLVGNALRYTEDGGIRLVVVQAADGTELRVEDTGPGIPAARQQEIWQPRARASDRGRGLGLGLHIVQRLARAMGGTAGVQSAEGAGSVFWVRLPLQPLLSVEVSAPQSAAPQAHPYRAQTPRMEIAPRRISLVPCS